MIITEEDFPMMSLVLKVKAQECCRWQMISLYLWNHLNGFLLILHLVRFFVFWVTFDMFWQMITSHESALTYGTGEFFLSSVSPFVPWKFVWSGKTTVASFEFADERPLTSVDAFVCFEMTGLEVVLATVGVFTLKDSSPFRWWTTGRWDCLGRDDGWECLEDDILSSWEDVATGWGCCD